MKQAALTLQKQHENSVLDGIGSPSDLKSLSVEGLEFAAGEIRERIISTVSQNGGHMASNLGVVELTIALHYVFNFATDRLLWDVGHQCYAHKLLTGRRDTFSTLRLFEGISGFPKRSESMYDAFGAGHSSTSLSAACGMAEALYRAGCDARTVAVIGDGALAGGMALEALNHAASLKGNLIVVLNDNGYSISPNSGALAEVLRSGDPAVFFKQMGFDYRGPLDGHDIPALITSFARIPCGRPVVIHVKTQKGRGLPAAVADPTRYHGVSPKRNRGAVQRSNPRVTFTQAFGCAICELAAQNSRIAAVTAGMSAGTGLSAFQLRYPDRFFDPGITEQHAVTFAAGLAAQGMQPVVAIYSTFIQRAYDQIVDVCLQNLPVVLALDRGGLAGPDGPTHHGVFDSAFLRCIPNLTIMAPKDPDELRHMLYTALTLDGPAAIRYPKQALPYSEPCGEFQRLKPGRSQWMRSGREVVIIAVSSMVFTALETARRLAERGVNCGVVNARFIKPVDAALIRECGRHTACLVTLEESCVRGGFGSSVSEVLQAAGIQCPLLSFGIPDRFIPHGTRDELLQACGLTPEMLVPAVMQRLGELKRRCLSRPHPGANGKMFDSAAPYPCGDVEGEYSHMRLI